MKKINTIFQLLVALYFVVALVYFFAFDTQDVTAAEVVVWLLVGASLFVISWILDNVYINGLKNNIKKLELDKNELKAKLYDRDQETRPSYKPETEAQPRVAKPPHAKPEQPDLENKEPSKIRPRQNFK